MLLDRDGFRPAFSDPNSESLIFGFGEDFHKIAMVGVLHFDPLNVYGLGL